MQRDLGAALSYLLIHRLHNLQVHASLHLIEWPLLIPYAIINATHQQIQYYAARPESAYLRANRFRWGCQNTV